MTRSATRVVVLGSIMLLAACSDPVDDLSGSFGEDIKVTIPDDADNLESLLSGAGGDPSQLATQLESMTPAQLAALQAALGVTDNDQLEELLATFAPSELEELIQLQEGLQEDPFSLLCASSDAEAAPAGFPFTKPPSMYALGYGPGTVGDYEIRGTTNNPTAVLNELRTQVFPGYAETVLSNIAGQEASDFVGPLGTARYGSTSVPGCTQVSISLRMGNQDESEAPAAETTSDDSSAGTSVGSESAPVAPAGGPDISVVTATGSYSPAASICLIDPAEVVINASGDGELTITGNAQQLFIQFQEPGGGLVELTEPGIVVAPGVLAHIASGGMLIIEANDCDS